MEPDSYVYYDVRKGMYELKKLASLAFDDLVKSYPPPLFPSRLRIWSIIDIIDEVIDARPPWNWIWYQNCQHKR